MVIRQRRHPAFTDDDRLDDSSALPSSCRGSVEQQVGSDGRRRLVRACRPELAAAIWSWRQDAEGPQASATSSRRRSGGKSLLLPFPLLPPLNVLSSDLFLLSTNPLQPSLSLFAPRLQLAVDPTASPASVTVDAILSNCLPLIWSPTRRDAADADLRNFSPATIYHGRVG
ncbi:hypothetical protein LINPERPRIM_LOCUS26570 [Linum perenne]